MALNYLYSTQIFVYSTTLPDVEDVARHIHRNAQSIDSALAAGSPEVVDTIAKVAVPEKKDRNYYSFATKYCSWQRPERYPIWDSHVDRYLWSLQKQTGFAKFFNANADLWACPRFREVMTAFRDRYGLGSFTFKEIDKFLWLYGGKSSAIEAIPIETDPPPDPVCP